MAEIINLNRVRKGKARATGVAAAAENRVRFGRSKADRVEAAEADRRAAKRIDGHRLEPRGTRPTDDDPPGAT